MIHVRQQYASDWEGRFGFSAPKSESGIRRIDLDPETVRILKAWEQHQLDMLGELYGGDELAARRALPDLAFVRLPDTTPLRPDSGVSAGFDRIVKRLDVPAITIHGLRHTHASHCVAAGMDLQAVKARMGHSSINTTLDRYGRLLPGQQAHGAAQVAAIVDRTA
jgi:integrase